MKKFAFAFVLALLTVIPAMAQVATGQAEPKKAEPAKEEPKKEEPKKEEPKKEGEVDAYKIYRAKGNTWTVKSTTKVSGMDEMVSYTKTEVTEVAENKATIKVTSLDKDQKEIYSHSMDIPFVAAQPMPKPDPDAPKVEPPKQVEEKVKVEAGEFECIKTEYEAAGTKTTTWTHKQYPGVTVKSTSKSDAMEMTSELTVLSIK